MFIGATATRAMTTSSSRPQAFTYAGILEEVAPRITHHFRPQFSLQQTCARGCRSARALAHQQLRPRFGRIVCADSKSVASRRRKGVLKVGARSCSLWHSRQHRRARLSTPKFRFSCTERAGRGGVVLCAYSGQGSSTGDSSDSEEGDKRVQQLLVDMVRLQVGKKCVDEMMDERVQHMIEIASESNVQLERIATRAMEGMDGVAERVLREFDADASLIERDLALARAELEDRERDLAAFEERIYYSRNEALFFKNLYPRPKSMAWKKISQKRFAAPRKVKIEVAVEVKPSATPSLHQYAASSYKGILYGGLSLVLLSFCWSASTSCLMGTCMRLPKFAAYGTIISLMLLQVRYYDELVGDMDADSTAKYDDKRVEEEGPHREDN